MYKKPFVTKRTELVFGMYPSIGLAEARELRTKANELLPKDIDPKEHKDELNHKQQAPLSNTFEQVAANWFQVKKTEISADYAKDLWRSLELHIFPALGKYPISKITAPLTIDIIKPIAAKGSSKTVKRLPQRLNEIMNYAVNTRLIHTSPLTGIKAEFKKPEKQNMPTFTPEKLLNFLAITSPPLV